MKIKETLATYWLLVTGLDRDGAAPLGFLRFVPQDVQIRRDVERLDA